MVIRAVLALFGGALLGGLGAWLVSPAAQVDGTSECTQRLAAAKQKGQALDTELQTLSEVYDERWRKRVAALGQALAWPDEVPAALQPEALRTHIQAVMDAKDGELLELDCNAYPCVAIVRWTSIPEEMEIIASGDEHALFPASMLADLTAHPDYAGRPMVDTGSVDVAADGTSVHGFAWYDAEDIRMAKRQSKETVEVDGDRVDQIEGRNEAVFNSWAKREQP